MPARIKALNLAKTIAVWTGLVLLGFAMAIHAAWAAPQAAKSFNISVGEIEALVSDALVVEGAGQTVEVTLSGNNPTQFHKSSRPVHASIEFIDYDARSLRWKGEIALYEGDSETRREAIAGRYASMVEIPVLNKRLYSGDIVEQDDIEWLSLPEHRLRKDTVYNPAALVGKSPRRVIAEGRAIQERELERPIVVKRGDLVQIQFKTPTMEIRTIGEALEDGSAGQLIPIRNSESEIVVRATITGPGFAEVNQLVQLSQS